MDGPMSNMRDIKHNAKRVLSDLHEAAESLEHPELRDQALLAADDQERSIVRVSSICAALDAIDRAKGVKHEEEE